MPSLQFFFDNNQGAQAGWNRLQLTGGTTGSGVSIAAGSVVGPDTNVVPGVGIDLSGILATMSSTTTTIFNSSASSAVISGDASWASSAVIVDGLQLSAVDLWYPILITDLGSDPHTVELFGTTAAGANNRWMHARVNGGTPQLLNVSNAQGANIIRIENITPVDGDILIEVAKHANGVGGNAIFNCGRVFPFAVVPTLEVQNGDLQPGKETEILCTNFATAPDASTAAVTTFVNGVATNSLPVSASVTDNMDTTYTVRFTMPAWSTVVGATAASLRTTHVDIPNGINITHKFTINPSA